MLVRRENWLRRLSKLSVRHVVLPTDGFKRAESLKTHLKQMQGFCGENKKLSNAIRNHILIFKAPNRRRQHFLPDERRSLHFQIHIVHKEMARRRSKDNVIATVEVLKTKRVRIMTQRLARSSVAPSLSA